MLLPIFLDGKNIKEYTKKAYEPIGNLDSKTGIEIMNLLKEINIEKGITIIQVTYSYESSIYGDRVIRIKDGQVQQ